MPAKRPSKRSLILSTRKKYKMLDRAYHAIGKKVLGTPKRAAIRKEYLAVKSARHTVGRRLGKLTGIR